MTSINFGSFATSGSTVDTAGTASVSCPAGGGPNQFFCVSIAGGSSSDATSRMMVSGTNSLRFELYKDAARTQIWGAYESGGIGYQSTIARGATVPLTVYARVFASQTVVPGTYTSTFSTTPRLTSRDNGSGLTCPVTPNASTTSFTVTATVLASCTISTTTLDFGSAGLLASNVDASSDITVNCTPTTPFQVALGAGNGASATTSNRRMTGPTSGSIGYALYRDGARSNNWGETTGTDTMSGTGSGSSQTLTVYGRVPPQAAPAPGTYSDTIVATVTY